MRIKIKILMKIKKTKNYSNKTKKETTYLMLKKCKCINSRTTNNFTYINTSQPSKNNEKPTV